MTGTSLSRSFRAASMRPRPCDDARLGIDQTRVLNPSPAMLTAISERFARRSGSGDFWRTVRAINQCLDPPAIACRFIAVSLVAFQVFLARL